jgi:hypothetical protein
MALRRALKLVRGLRKQISEAEESVMAGKLPDEITTSNYEIVRRPGAPGHTLTEGARASAFASDHQKNRRNEKEGCRPGVHSGERRRAERAPQEISTGPNRPGNRHGSIVAR